MKSVHSLPMPSKDYKKPARYCRIDLCFDLRKEDWSDDEYPLVIGKGLNSVCRKHGEGALDTAVRLQSTVRIRKDGVVLIRSTPETLQWVKTKKTYVEAHRVILGRIRKKPLEKGLRVTHIDGNKANNRPGNLMTEVSEIMSRESIVKLFDKVWSEDYSDRVKETNQVRENRGNYRVALMCCASKDIELIVADALAFMTANWTKEMAELIEKRLDNEYAMTDEEYQTEMDAFHKMMLERVMTDEEYEQHKIKNPDTASRSSKE